MGARSTDGLRRDQRVAAELLRLDRQRYAVEQRTSLTGAELRLLWLFSDDQPRTLREVAAALHLEQSTVNRQVNGAIRAGHLRRFTEQGRAAGLIAATPAGRRLFADDTALVLRLYDEALDALGDEEAPRFVELLGRFVAAYTEAAALVADPPPAPARSGTVGTDG